MFKKGFTLAEVCASQCGTSPVEGRSEQLMTAVMKLKSPRRRRNEAIFDCTGGRKAFTLAEVLITLTIIGIVAALTIPSVISNYQQQEYKTGLKKAVSALNAAIQTNIAQDGETPYENSDLFSYLQRHMNILRNMNKVRTCIDKSTGKPYDFAANGKEACLSEGNYGIGTENAVFYTADGMRFERQGKAKDLKLHETGVSLRTDRVVLLPHYMNYNNKGFCGSYGLSNNANDTKFPPCLIVVDVNGDKKPNTLEAIANTFSGDGYNTKNINTYPSPSDKKVSDVFTIMITDKEAIPFGVVAQRAMYSK